MAQELSSKRSLKRSARPSTARTLQGTKASAKGPEKRRKMSADERKVQLIRATLKCIARRGIIGTTLGLVAKEAGLSQGIVNLHFKSKENLLNETLGFLADDYLMSVQRAFEKTPDNPVAKLTALMEVDFSTHIFTRQKIAVWYAFQGEAKSRPTYRKICQQRDAELDNVMVSIVDQIIIQGGYQNIEAQVVVDALSALTSGLWLSYLINPEPWNAQRARTAAFSYLVSVFPKEFGQGRNHCSN